MTLHFLVGDIQLANKKAWLLGNYRTLYSKWKDLPTKNGDTYELHRLLFQAVCIISQ
jgi:hypothetical protein